MVSEKLDQITMSLQKFNPSIYKILEQEAKKLPKTSCDCPCHEYGLFHHNPCLSILSNLQCLECKCKPIPFNASEITILQIHVQKYWKKLNGYANNMVVSSYPDWIREDIIFMRVLLEAKLNNLL